MERNEHSSLDAISLGTLFKRAITASLLILASFAALQAQDQMPGAAKPPQKKYSIKVVFPSNTASSYVINEKTIVKRDYRDDQHKNYERNVSYFVTMGKIGETDDGLVKILCNIDSLKYSFKDNNTTLHYDSEDPKASNIKGDFADLTYTQAPLNHMFVMLLDDKNTVVKVTGNNENNDIEWIRKYILEDGATIMDTAQKFLWLDGISENRLKSLFDMNGGLVREKMIIAEDSTWSRPSSTRLDCIEFTDTITAKVSTVSRGVYSIETKVSGLKANTSREHRMFGIPAPAIVESTVSGGGQTKIKVNQQGSIRAYEADYSTVINGRYKNEKFVQSITTSIRCNILNQFGW